MDELGISQSQLSLVVSGCRRISLDLALELKEQTDLPLDFILTNKPDRVMSIVSAILEEAAS